MLMGVKGVKEPLPTRANRATTISKKQKEEINKYVHTYGCGWLPTSELYIDNRYIIIINLPRDVPSGGV